MEILTVVAIMSILSAVVVWSFGASRAAGLTAAGNTMVDVVSMARQNSISKNAYTAVVIKRHGDHALAAYCLVQLVRGDDGTFSTWQPLSAWRYLQPGIVFETGQVGDTFITDTPALPLPLPTQYSYKGQVIDLTEQSVWQCFQPDGTLFGQQNPPVQLRLIEGVADTSDSSVAQGPTSGGAVANYYQLLFVSNTGVAMVQRP